MSGQGHGGAAGQVKASEGVKQAKSFLIWPGHWFCCNFALVHFKFRLKHIVNASLPSSCDSFVSLSLSNMAAKIGAGATTAKQKNNVFPCKQRPKRRGVFYFIGLTWELPPLVPLCWP